MDLSVLKMLGIVDCAILQHTQNNKFVLQDTGSNWIHNLLPNISASHEFEINEQSIFLTDFLIDANAYWQSNHQDKQVRSGIWTEQVGSHSFYLEAYASKFENNNYLVIKNAEPLYFERKQTLQVARELSISNDKVVERHDYLNERLRSILLDNAQTDNRLPLHDAIKYASIGVIITDAKLFIQDINPAAFDIFDQEMNTNQDHILVSIKALVERQYPEKNFFSSPQHWEGELFWHTPPVASKWLKVNIHPVLTQNGQIGHWIISFSDQTRIKHLLQTNEELALHDPLTGLPNRQYFWQTLQQCISNEEPFCLMSIDIINFKYANEMFGYLSGDDLLKQVSARIASQLDADDFITRIGADEFMIIRKLNDERLIANNTSFIDDTVTFASDLLNLCAQPIFTKDQRRCELPIKIGITQYPKDSKKPEELLNYADLALSQAKITNNSAIQLYNEQLKEASSRRLLLEEALKNAIDNNELELYLQPIYDIANSKVIKAEALVRWRYKGELVMPGEFIPIAENSDSINVIGRWVINRTCEMIKRLAADNISVPISINFSPKQIYDTNLVGFIKAHVESLMIDPGMIELEITEGVLINSYQRVSLFLNELKHQGFSISVDDFGTGYCSLAYLKNLPIDTLKIDQSFIKDVTIDENDNAIVSAIIALAQKLNLSIIAEGIETQAQQDFLALNNCNVGQGFMYSKPLTLSEFTSFVHKQNH